MKPMAEVILLVMDGIRKNVIVLHGAENPSGINDIKNWKKKKQSSHYHPQIQTVKKHQRTNIFFHKTWN